MSSTGNGLGSIGNIGPIGSLPQMFSEEKGESEQGFGAVLSNALAQVNELSNGADQQVGNLLKGTGGDMSSVMVAVEKADVAFQLMMQVRNKIVSAYQDIEKLQF
jgi:flagellar hook-basal body complex protein FliE